MGKIKKPKRVNSDAINAKKSSQQNDQKSKKVNPFEVHLNKEKFDILGRQHKHDRGRPGASRGKAMKRRVETLGKEFKQLNKTNKFKDNRIGRENSGNDSVASARFMAEQISEFRSKKKDLFNLNDDEILTHRGQTLEEIEQFRDDLASDESEDETLNAEFTETAHFGGGSGVDGIDRKAAIEDMIAESKRKKAEILKDKEEVYQLTNKLDQNYKNLIPLMGKLSKKDIGETKKTSDDYDRIMREMVFEPRGEVSDKLQSEEEIARKEKERLEKLEWERLARMRGEEIGQDNKPKHRSADDLDDGYYVAGGNSDEEEKTLAYPLKEDSKNAELDKENLSEDEDDLLPENDISNEDEVSNQEDQGDENDEIDNSSEDHDSKDDLSDLKVTDSESEEDNIQELKNLKKRSKTDETESIEDRHSKAVKALPFTYDMPADYLELKKLLIDQPADYHNVIVERILKCNHPKLDGTNRQKIVHLFDYLLKYIGEQFSVENIEKAFKILDRLMPQLYDLIQLNPQKCSEIFIQLLKTKYTEFKKNSKIFFNLELLSYFKIISNLYSTSDFRHPVVTLVFVFISHILSRIKIKTRQDIAYGLFLCTLILEYTQLSKRFLPACFNYLLGTIYLSIPKRPIEILKIIPPFQTSGISSVLLVLENKMFCKEEVMSSKDLIESEIDDTFKVRALNVTLKLLKDSIEIVEDNIGSGYIAESFIEILERLNLKNYPKFVNENFNKAREILLKQTEKKLKKLTPVERKPKALRLMEPRIEKVYDDKRRPKMTKEKEMRKIMEHKIKRETKGALREIRRDNEFLQTLKIKKQIESDIERREKVKRIYSEAALQQGELNEMSRKKKKGKF